MGIFWFIVIMSVVLFIVFVLLQIAFMGDACEKRNILLALRERYPHDWTSRHEGMLDYYEEQTKKTIIYDYIEYGVSKAFRNVKNRFARG